MEIDNNFPTKLSGIDEMLSFKVFRNGSGTSSPHAN